MQHGIHRIRTSLRTGQIAVPAVKGEAALDVIGVGGTALVRATLSNVGKGSLRAKGLWTRAFQTVKARLPFDSDAQLFHRADSPPQSVSTAHLVHGRAKVSRQPKEK